MRWWPKAAWGLDKPCFRVPSIEMRVTKGRKGRELLRYVLQRIDEYPDVRNLHIVLQPRDFVMRHQNQVSRLQSHILLELQCVVHAGEIQLLYFIDGVIEFAKDNY